MKKSFLIVIAIAAAGLLLFIGIVLAHGFGYEQGCCMMSGEKWWQNPDYAKKLALTDKEKTALDNLYTENAKKMIDLRAAMQKDALNISQILDTQNMDEETALAKFKEHQNSHLTMAEEHFKYLLEVRKIIGVERFQQLRAINNCNFGYGMSPGYGRGIGRGMGKRMGRGMRGNNNPYCPLMMQ